MTTTSDDRAKREAIRRRAAPVSADAMTGRPTKKLIEPPTEKQIAAWPKEWQNDHWSTLGVDTFVEVHGRSPGTPPEYDDCVTELDTWAASPEGQRELKRRGIKPWW